MTIWILEDSVSKTPKYEIIKGNIHIYKSIGWAYNVYKCEDKDVQIPDNKNKLFKFKGYKCNLIYHSHLTNSFIDDKPIYYNDKEYNKNKELFDTIKNYEYFNDVVDYEEYEIKYWWSKKIKKKYKMKIKEFVVKTGKILETHIISNYVIKSEFNIDNKEIL